MIMDVGAGGGGIPIYDQLGQITKDSERGIEYPPFTIMRHESIDEAVYKELSERTLGINALPVIYCFSATQKLNSVLAIEMKDKLQKKLWGFLIDETQAEEYLIKTKSSEYMKSDDVNTRTFFIHPYVQTSLMVNEAINLEMVLTNANIKLVEPNTGRKDRIVTLMMGNYYASLLDPNILKTEDQESDWDALLGVSYIG